MIGHHAITSRYKKKVKKQAASPSTPKIAKKKKTVAKKTKKASPKKVDSPSRKTKASDAVGTKPPKSALRNRVYSAAYHKCKTASLKRGMGKLASAAAVYM